MKISCFAISALIFCLTGCSAPEAGSQTSQAKGPQAQRATPFSRRYSSVKLLAKTGDVIGGFTIRRFGLAALNDKGEIAFNAFYTIPNNETEYTGIFKLNKFIAGRTTPDPRGELSPGPPHMNNAGDVVFTGLVSKPDSRIASVGGLFLNEKLILDVYARPEFGGILPSHVRISNNGRITFSGHLIESIEPATGAVVKIFPDAVQGHEIIYLSAYSINDSGEIVAPARWKTTTGAADEGVVSRDKIYSTGPSTQSVPPPGINNKGQVAYVGPVDNGNPPRLGVFINEKLVDPKGQLVGINANNLQECPWECLQLNDAGTLLVGSAGMKDGELFRWPDLTDDAFWKPILGKSLRELETNDIHMSCVLNNLDQMACTVATPTDGWIVLATP